MPLLAEKVVLVSGGTQGVGAGIVRAAVREGAQVAFTGRRTETGQSLVDDLEAEGGDVAFIRADLSDAAQATGSVERTVERFGRVDCLVNSAGLTTRGTLLDTSPDLFERHIAINLRAPFFTMQAAVRDMVKRHQPGTIVNIISMAAHGGQPYLAPYVAAKAGLVGLTRNAAFAHRWDKVRINGVNIGWTQTEGEDLIQRQSRVPTTEGSSAPGEFPASCMGCAPCRKRKPLQEPGRASGLAAGRLRRQTALDPPPPGAHRLAHP